MSRIGKMPVTLPKGVQVKTAGRRIEVTGALGTLSREIPVGIDVKMDGDAVQVSRSSESKTARSLHGLIRALIYNMVEGVSAGFTSTLEIEGIGYKVKEEKSAVSFELGYSHTILFFLPVLIAVTVNTPTGLSVAGIDKELVGQVAAKIRALRPPAVYTGKGIRYKGEVIRRKAGKGGAKV